MNINKTVLALFLALAMVASPFAGAVSAVSSGGASFTDDTGDGSAVTGETINLDGSNSFGTSTRTADISATNANGNDITVSYDEQLDGNIKITNDAHAGSAGIEVLPHNTFSQAYKTADSAVSQKASYLNDNTWQTKLSLYSDSSGGSPNVFFYSTYDSGDGNFDRSASTYDALKITNSFNNFIDISKFEGGVRTQIATIDYGGGSGFVDVTVEKTGTDTFDISAAGITKTVTYTPASDGDAVHSMLLTGNQAASYIERVSGTSVAVGSSTTVDPANLVEIDDGGSLETLFEPTNADPFVDTGQDDAQFTNEAQTTNTNTAAISSYSWAFGDGTTATGQTVSHAYDSTGTYSITLEATDSTGAVFTSSQSVSVEAAGGGEYGGGDSTTTPTETLTVEELVDKSSSNFTQAGVETLSTVGGGNLEMFVTVDSNGTSYAGTLVRDAAPTNSTYVVGEKNYTNAGMVLDDENNTVVALDEFQITSATDRVSGEEVQSFAHYDYSDLSELREQLEAIQGGSAGSIVGGSGEIPPLAIGAGILGLLVLIIIRD